MLSHDKATQQNKHSHHTTAMHSDPAAQSKHSAAAGNPSRFSELGLRIHRGSGARGSHTAQEHTSSTPAAHSGRPQARREAEAVAGQEVRLRTQRVV